MRPRSAVGQVADGLGSRPTFRLTRRLASNKLAAIFLMSEKPHSPGSDTFHAVAASFLGWTLDAFDYFVVVFLVDTLAHDFGVEKSAIVWSLTATLAMRP